MTARIFEWVFVIGWAVYLFGIYSPNAIRYKKRYKKNEVIEDRSRPVDVALDMLAFLGWQALPLVYVFSSWLDFADYHLPAWTGWPGALLLAAAILLYWRAYAELGKHWSPKIEILNEQELVTSGVYHRIRHPVYAAMWLWALANPLLLHNWVAGLALIVLFTPLYLLRVPQEEAMMLEQFGDQYRAYMARTGRLFPRLGAR